MDSQLSNQAQTSKNLFSILHMTPLTISLLNIIYEALQNFNHIGKPIYKLYHFDIFLSIY